MIELSDYEKEKDKIRANSYFYKDGKLRVDLSEEDFELWQKYFIEKEIDCKNFVCVHDSDSCGIYDLCNITHYSTYQNLYPERSNKCGIFDKIWVSKKGDEPYYLHKEENWQGIMPKEACLECTGRRFLYSNYNISKVEYEKLKEAGYQYVFKYESDKPKKDKYGFHYYKSWCKELNDFMLKRGYIVNREFEKYEKNPVFKDLAHCLSGDAEAKVLKFQVEMPKILKRLEDTLNDIFNR